MQIVVLNGVPHSVSGLLAARICHDHFEDVVIVEPEAWLETEDAKRVDAWNQENIRSRVMQYHSLQGALASGIFEKDPLVKQLIQAFKFLVFWACVDYFLASRRNAKHQISSQ